MTEKNRDERTKFNLENCLKMAFHPKGNRRFAEGVIKELDIDKTYAANSLRFSCTSFDIAKYLLYASAIGAVIYNSLKN